MTTCSTLRPRIGASTLLLGAILALSPGAEPALAQAAPASSSARTTAPHPPPTEQFDEFFNRFRQDSSFQLSRVRFPLPWYSQADDATRQLTRKSWQFEPFYSAQETYTQVFDNFAMWLADSDERVFALIGVASDIRQNFFFRRLDGRWFLVRVEDLSM